MLPFSTTVAFLRALPRFLPLHLYSWHVTLLDGAVRAREVMMLEVEPGHERGRRGTRRSAVQGRRTDGKPVDSQMQRWPP